MEIDRTKLVNKIEQTAKAIPFAEILKGAFGRATTMVKQAFGELGQRLEFQIAASGYIDSSQEECLYDMVWYILENGMMVRQPMVLEIEWKNIPADVCDDEFQKLVQARANVRVWIATSPNSVLAEQHIANCKKQIELFSGTMHGDRYVFVIYDWTGRTPIVQQFVAP